MKLFAFVSLAALAAAQSWTPQESGITASLRGIAPVSAAIAWASGSNGAVLRTRDGGAHWHTQKVAGAADLDFRAVQAIDETTAVLLSIGPGEKSRVYKTGDGGANWELMYTNPDPKGFFDAIAFWDNAHGILLGDPVNGHFVVMTTSDGGGSWKRQKAPSALKDEGAFAASNTCLFIHGTREAWIGTGAARVLHTTDGGETWSVAKTPVRKDSASAGIFSIAFENKLHGVAVGGDYKNPTDAASNIAITQDGGKSWTPPAQGPSGFRSAVVYVPEMKAWISTGTSGSDISTDGGETWKQFDSGNYNALAFSSGAGWAVGPKGAVAKFTSSPH